MSYKDEIKEAWLKENGLVTKVVAARILDVSQSVITRHPELKRYKIGEDEFISFRDVLNSNIKPRPKRKNIASASACKKPDGTITTTAKASEGTVETSATPDGKLTAKAQTIKAIKKQ